MTDLRTNLFKNYKQIHSDYLENAGADHVASRLHWFEQLYIHNYAQYINHPDSTVLEIGCGRGYFLKVLQDMGFKHLYGIDLSPEDAATARSQFGLSDVFVGDVHELVDQGKQFDVIFSKDVLEHIEEASLGDFVETIARGLTPNGLTIFQVPNMDWIASPHERYMDLTHTIGFTRESLGQLLRLYFQEVDIHKVRYIFPQSPKQKLFYEVLRRLYLKLYSFHLRIMSEGAENTWFESREIMAVCRIQ